MKLSTTPRTFLALALVTTLATVTICPAQCLAGEVVAAGGLPCHDAESKSPIDSANRTGCCAPVVLAKAPAPELAPPHDLFAPAAPVRMAIDAFAATEPSRTRAFLHEHSPPLFLRHRKLLI